MSTASTNLGLRHVVARALRRSLAFAFPLVAGLAACGGTSDAPMCSASTTPQAADKFCAPSHVAAGQALKLQISEQCGGCTKSATKCEVMVSGQDIKLQLMGNVCVLPPGAACPAICSVNTFDCAVPALAAGSYRVATPAGSTTVSMITADAITTTTSCTVTTP